MATIKFNNASFDDERILKKSLNDFIDFQMPRVFQGMRVPDREEALRQLYAVAKQRVSDRRAKEGSSPVAKPVPAQRKETPKKSPKKRVVKTKKGL